MDERLTKRQLKELRKLESQKNQGSGGNGRVKAIAIVVVCILFVVFFVGLILALKQKKQTVSTTNLTRNGWVRGNAKAKVTLLEFGDLQCPACKSYEPLVEQVMHDFNGRIKLIFKHFPLTQVHKNAMAAAVFSEAAGRQGKFWEVHDLLYKNQDEWGEITDPQPFFDKYAQSLKLNLDQIHKDGKDTALAYKINQSEDDGIAIGVDATPTFYLDSKKIDSPADYNGFKNLIQKELKLVAGSK